MWGGVFGLSYVENARWGGLPLTLILSTFGIAFAFPIGVLLALGRRSNAGDQGLCVVELIRGVPLISLLVSSSVMLPLFLPEGFSIDKLLRAQIAIIMFAAAYIAETVRGGLQAIPKGQYEGADSLGLNYWQQMRKIILPQALKIVIPPLVSIFIALFKDTSLVVIIGIFDLTLAAKAACPTRHGAGSGWRRTCSSRSSTSCSAFPCPNTARRWNGDWPLARASHYRASAARRARTAISTGVQACLMPSFVCRT